MGPILGGVVAGLLYEYVFAENASINKAMEFLLASKYETKDFPVKEVKLNIPSMDDTDELKNLIKVKDRESVL